jgi:hypothetical protein
VKDHETGPVPAKTAVLYLVRSPFDTLLAEFTRKMTEGNHTGVILESNFEDEDFMKQWVKFVDRRISQWMHHVDFYLTNDLRGKPTPTFEDPVNKNLKNVKWTDHHGKPVHVIFFENLQRNLNTEIESLITWITPIFEKGLLPSPQEAAACVSINRTGEYKREHKHRFNPYTKAQKLMICERAKRIWHDEVWGSCDGSMQWERDQRRELWPRGLRSSP